ncbi:hypothetical protein [Mycobacterium xenopi]|uniref:hypothetical protein n=1 Tax=Mycobacterium xenopi TaxID=1789 RepID=UPI000A15EF2B|nr:hypothetical protein [Mycobacterium xenopi]ORX13069.1 hypothetical protein AWC32_15715 [Mycobacterium xenopi]SPX94932.1 Uncharacterised protein [Mycobacterium xenopi]
MKLPRPIAQRPTPRMPVLAGFEPRFDAIPTPRTQQPAEVVRPLYWWAKALRDRGDILLGVRFDAAALTAVVTVRQASYRVIEVVRRHNDKPRVPHDLASLLAEAVWRLGALGWSHELEAMVDLLRAIGLITAPVPVRPCANPLPGWGFQPDRAVRIAYWWALALLRHGWRLHACGEEIARYGFIAEIPAGDGDAALVVYPGDVSDDGTEASALAHHLARLGKSQRLVVQRVITDAAAGKGRVI